MISKEVIDRIVELGNNETLALADGRFFSRNKLHQVKNAVPNPLIVRSLSGMVQYLKSKFDGQRLIMVHVESPTRVSAFSSYNADMDREHYITAEAMLPEMNFGQYYDAESFNIKLQSVFVNTNERASLLKIVGNIKEDNVQTTGDDGISQKITAKTGVATVSDVVIPNPVTLFPFRTFVELQQPESLFVFRMKSGPQCALFDADGGAWKVEAMDSIKSYLEAALSEEIEFGNIVVIA